MKYRISKYSPSFRDPYGAYIRDDWTSYSDIGKEFSGEKLTAERYLAVERKYCDIVKSVSEENQISRFHVCELEHTFSLPEIDHMLSCKGLTLSSEEKECILSIDNGNIVTLRELNQVVTLILRDAFWCKLVGNRSNYTIEFGYDLYVYITCDVLTEMFIANANQSGVYIEEFSL